MENHCSAKESPCPLVTVLVDREAFGKESYMRSSGKRLGMDCPKRTSSQPFLDLNL